jgi:uncharacterized membrane protein
MLTIIKSLFRDAQQFHLFVLLCLSTAFNFALIGVRIYHLDLEYQQLNSVNDLRLLRGTTGFLFLIWNLLLAWVPYCISLVLERSSRRFNSGILTCLLLVSWLLFFPNAPYILTDFLHLRNRAPIPYWYDLMLLASFAWTGLILGLLSLYEVQLFLRKRIGNWLSWLSAVAAIFLCGFGIYLGRFLRWNSWDVLTQPTALAAELFDMICHPSSAGNELGIALVLSVFLLLAYLKMVLLMGTHKELPLS